MHKDPRTVIFFFRVYNDTDHLSPVAWKCLREGWRVEIVLIDKNQSLDHDRDPRLALLRRFSNCRMYYYYSSAVGFGLFKKFSLARFRGPFARKIIKIIFGFLNRHVFDALWAENFIRLRRPAVCAFDFCETSRDTLEGKLITACKKWKVPLICLPHGAHFITSYGEGSEQFGGAKNEAYSASRNLFDVIVEPNPCHEWTDWDKKLIERKKIVFLGSARYCPEWFSIARNFWPDFKPVKNDTGRLKLIFFLPRWEGTVDKEGVLRALDALAADPGIYLAVKEHTREGAGNLPREIDSKLAASDNAELVRGSRVLPFNLWLSSLIKVKKKAGEVVDSVALVRWCDAAVNIRGSIGLEVVLQSKTLINPTYLHKGRTIFEDKGAGIECRNLSDLLLAVERCRVSKETPPLFYDSSALLKNSIYAGKEPVDVLSTYTELISTLQRENDPGKGIS